MPAHVRAEAGVPAGVVDELAEHRVRRGVEAAAVGVRRRPPGGGIDPDEALRLLDVAQGARPRVGSRAIARLLRRTCGGHGRARIEQPADPGRDVRHRRPQSADRGEGAGPRRDELLEAAVRSPPEPGHDRRWRERGDVEPGRLQAQRPEDLLGDDLGVGPAGRLLDDPPEQRVPEVRVLVPGAGGEPPQRRPGDELAEFGRSHRLEPVRPGVVGGQAAGHGQRVADGDRTDRGTRLRHELGNRIVEVEAPVGGDRPVPDPQHRGRGEGLRHRGDAERPVEVLPVDQPAVEHEPPGNLGRRMRGERLGEVGAHGGACPRLGTGSRTGTGHGAGRLGCGQALPRAHSDSRRCASTSWRWRCS